MERQRALDELPDVYARALSLRDRGHGSDAIAAALDIVPEAVGSLLRLGEAKLERILTQEPAGGPESHESTPASRLDWTDEGAAEA